MIDRGENNQNHSIYNTKFWNGAGDFKREIELAGYDVMSVQSSLSATDRLINKTINNKEKTSILLVLLGITFILKRRQLAIIKKSNNSYFTIFLSLKFSNGVS